MKRYRVDIFSKDFTFKDFALTSNPKIMVDYLVFEKSSVQIPTQLNVAKGDYIVIYGEDNFKFYGLVTDYDWNDKLQTISFEQMYKLFDVEVFADANELDTISIEQWLSNALSSVYNGTDAFQNLTGFTTVITSNTMGTYQYSQDGIYNLYDLLVHFFKVNGVICEITLDVIQKKIIFRFKSIDYSSIWKIETEIADVLDYNVNQSMNMDYPNKTIYRNEQDPTEEITYYWHPSDYSGTINTDPSGTRVFPVIQRARVVAPEDDPPKTFQQVAYADAYNTMYQSIYDDQIEITFNADSKLVEVGNIGQLYRIIDHEKIYQTVLTGYNRLNDKHILLTFGYVRSRLTQILKIERRYYNK